jgi:hypothetical protein
MAKVYCEDLHKEFDLDVLAKDNNNICTDIQYEGKKIYLVQDSYFDNDNWGDACAFADAIDVDGNLYRVKWEITNPDAEDGSDACDWDNYSVKRI